MANETNNYSIARPVLGGDQDQWGSILNNAIGTIDTTIKTVSDAVPTTVFQSSITDTPNSLGSAKQVLRVNSAGNNTEFATPSVLDLSDTPSSMGSAGQVLKVNSGGTALEFATDISGSGSSGIALTDLSFISDASASGSGGVSYNNTNGQFQYTPPDLSSYSTIKTYTSGWQSFDNSLGEETETFNHGLGGMPDIVNFNFKCTTAELGYSVGDIVMNSDMSVEQSGVPIAYIESSSTTQIKVQSSYNQAFGLTHKTTGQRASASTGYWQWRIQCVKF